MSIEQINLSAYKYTQKLNQNSNQEPNQIKNVEKQKQKNYNGEVDFDTFKSIFKDANNKVKAFEKFINKLLTYQGSKAVEGKKNKANTNIDVDIEININIDINGIEKEESKPIEIEGYWGAEETSQRILEFAKNISGGNPEKYDLLLDSFKKGFEEAKKCFGGELPDVCNKTYDLVLEGFEEMKEI